MNAYYGADIYAFRNQTPDEILGEVARNSRFAIEQSQRDAWLAEIWVLKEALQDVSGHVFLEFIVPRIGSRIDAVVISGPVIFVVEFKVGEGDFHRADINQAWDYALDLKNFHRGSHTSTIIPVLVATNAPELERGWADVANDGVYPPVICGQVGLKTAFERGLRNSTGTAIDAIGWSRSDYQPTPTIVEAAQALYANHSVDAITRSDAGASNLNVTSRRVEEIVDFSRQESRKSIVFVTGVPGAGKTLVGLNVATKRRDEKSSTHAVFLSGNGPLVAVLCEALTRDEVKRIRASGNKTRKGVVEQKVKTFIQNVHHFRDAGLSHDNPPADHVVIFDEAQRAWNQEMTADFMRRRRGLANFDQSEPSFLISYVDRHQDWGVVVCLVGGGQEINRGEAGIASWIQAIELKFAHWDVYVSPNLSAGEYAIARELQKVQERSRLRSESALHLSVSMRSFRAENVSLFVQLLLDCDIRQAKQVFSGISGQYPIVLTRSLSLAKQWVRQHARGSERFGLVASSSAQRLKPHAIDVRVEIDPIHWFLNESDDTRSSFYLEDAATEFQVQGLELDWVCVTWDADLRLVNDLWSFHSFVGSKWNFVNMPERQRYLKNAYRVLLTRARQGMVIFVPEGDPEDRTRMPAYYDNTFSYLASTGIPVLQSGLASVEVNQH